MKASLLAAVSLAVLLLTAACMEETGRSGSTSTGTNVEALHPAALFGMTAGSTDSECSYLCSTLDGCSMLTEFEISLEECVTACEAGYFDDYKECILAASDCYGISTCFY